MIHWAPFIILSILILLVQTTVGSLLAFTVTDVGTVSPDLLALVVTTVAMWARNPVDIMLVAWVVGFVLDLASTGGIAGASSVGPMALGYALSAGVVYRIREAFFREKVLPQAMLVLIFCLLANLFRVSMQMAVSWHWQGGTFGRQLIQAVLLSLYTAVMVVPFFWIFSGIHRWLITTPPGRGGRS